MKISIDESPDYADTEITIKCSRMDEELLLLLAKLRAFDKKVTGIKDGTTHILQQKDILYFESVDKKTFAYTSNEVYETSLKLYEIEQMLGPDFFRASKSTVISLDKISELSHSLNGRINVVLDNGERLIISRQYVPILKSRLGI